MEICADSKKPPSGPQWLHEIKLDGYRMAARIDNGPAQLLTRAGSTGPPNIRAPSRRLRPTEIRGRRAGGREDHRLARWNRGARRELT